MSEIRTAKDLYVVIIGKTKTVAQHVEENKWRICGSMVNYQNTDVDVIKALDLANAPSTNTEKALNIDSVVVSDAIEYNIGDRVTIIKEESGHGFLIGEDVFIIEKHTEEDKSIYYEATNNKEEWSVNNREIKPCG